MQLQSIRKNAEATAGADVSIRSLVITVPPFYTANEKRAVEMAAELAGLRVLNFISDGLAVGLHYATSRQFPSVAIGAKPEYHLVFDMGAGSTKATVMKFQSNTIKDVGRFNKTIQEVIVLGTAWDKSLGGDLFNSLIVDDMLAQFAASKGAVAASITADGVKSHGRAIAKLNKDAERLRQILSANAETHSSFEGLYEDVDFKYQLSRAHFEKMTEAHAEQVVKVVKNALQIAQVDISDLSSVILHGGASRTPFVQKALERAAGSVDKIRTNVNSDEAAVMGAGFKAAELSPGFRVKEIRTVEGNGYPSGLRWTSTSGKEQHQRLWSSISAIGGPVKEVTIPSTEDIDITFYQTVGDSDRDIKLLKTQNLTATVAKLKDTHACPDNGIVIRLGVKLNDKDGEVVVTRLVAECEGESDTKDGFVGGMKNLFGFGKRDQVPLVDDNAPVNDAEPSSISDESMSSISATSSTSSSSSPSASPMSSSSSSSLSSSSTISTSTSTASSEVIAAKAKISIPVKHVVENAGLPALNKDSLQKTKSRLKAFDASDRNRRAREEALNQLEAFTYGVRDLLENEAFVAASTDVERAELETKSSDASEWIYDDGADAPKDELKKRLDELKSIANPIQKRVKEAAERPGLVKAVRDAMSQAVVFIKTMRDQIDEYDTWQSSSSAATEAASTVAPDIQPASSSDDFEGLEDDLPSTKPADALPVGSIEELLSEHGPMPPMYSRADLDELKRAHDDLARWLTAQQTAQDELEQTADPVLLSSELRKKKDDLEKLSLDLALKGMRSFESTAKKMTQEEKAKREKKAEQSKDRKKKAEDKQATTEQEPKVESPVAEEMEGEREEQPMESDMPAQKDEATTGEQTAEDNPSEAQLEATTESSRERDEL